jgi:hypothetical protein
MMITMLALAFMLINVPSTPSTSSQGSPRIKCEIEMSSWCIASFDGAISMEDLSTERIWKLQARNGMESGPLLIIEAKACFDSSSSSWKMASTPKKVMVHGANFESYVYEAKDGCRLEFQWPAAGVDASIYRQVMLFGILVGKFKDRQIYGINGSS